MPSDAPALDASLQFETLLRENTLSQRVVRQLETLLTGTQLQPGDRLPAERELARQFGVSRTVIREAVAALVAKGLLEVAAGSGTIIRRPSADFVAQSLALYLRSGQPHLDYANVHEARRTLEVEIAGLAAARRTDADLQQMQALLEAMATQYDTPDLYIANDVAYHRALALATHNPLFPLLLDSIVDIMLEVRRLGLRVPRNFESGKNHHQAIFEQVRAGNSEEARHAMLAHLLDSEAIMKQALESHAHSGK
jgi:GntR family transcriptional regulator, transcriptional repressor for pyruvate dehydrogenase complex